MNSFSIKDLENISGVKAHTIRIWELRYSFLKPKRTGTNIRHYTGDELKTILNISLLNKYGFKISTINKMTEEQRNEKVLSLAFEEAQQERVVNELIQYLIDLDIDSFEQTLTKQIKAKGVEQGIVKVIFPFLDRIGILWLTNHINPAQEHLASNIIRQKLIAGIEGLPTKHQGGKTALLFLPEGEHHELGLLFIYYLLKNRGIKVFYVGTNVPMKDLEYIVNLTQPDLLYCHLTSVAERFSFEKFFSKLQKDFAKYQVIVSGQSVQSYKKKIPANVHLKKSLEGVMEQMSSL
jgi:DNA-binding transcriptional MerR regulator